VEGASRAPKTLGARGVGSLEWGDGSRKLMKDK